MLENLIQGQKMIIQFRFKNFRSFRDEQIISMVASSEKAMPENTFSTPALSKHRLMRSAVIYGANASGKSNVIGAIGFFKTFIRASVDKPVEAEIPVHPFQLNKKSAASPSEFELTFISNKVRYQYGFLLDRQKVHSEWLIAYPKGLPQKWFERNLGRSGDESEWYFGSQLRGEKEKLTSLTRPDVLFLSVAAKFNHKQLSPIYKWLGKYLRVMETDNDVPHFLYTAKQAKASDVVRDKVQRLLEFADLGIVDFSIEEQESLPENMPEELRNLITKGDAEWSGKFSVQLRHRSDEHNGDISSLSLENESKGTQRLFCLSGRWVNTLQNGYSLIVDELGSSLHPLLVRGLVEMFHDNKANLNNAQLIFNTHDTTLLEASIFRRDQIWLVEKDNSGASHLYPLLDFSPRKEESLGKWYLRGRYGAIPLLGSLGILSGEAPGVEK